MQDLLDPDHSVNMYTDLEVEPSALKGGSFYLSAQISKKYEKNGIQMYWKIFFCCKVGEANFTTCCFSVRLARIQKNVGRS